MARRAARRSEVDSLPETRSTDDPAQHRVVIVGGGAAGLELATRLGERLGRVKAASITLLDRSRTHVWKPLLHEVAAGSLDSDVDAVDGQHRAARQAAPTSPSTSSP